MRSDQVSLIGRSERKTPAEGLEKQYPETVDVTTGTNRARRYQRFWRGVLQSPPKRRLVIAVGFSAVTHSQVDERRVTGRRHVNVARCDISVNPTGSMESPQALGQLAKNPQTTG